MVSRSGGLTVKATLRCGDMASPLEMVGVGARVAEQRVRQIERDLALATVYGTYQV